MPYRSGFITIIGRPNVGKSTLLNQILGEKIAIVSDKPQTTRTRLLGICNLPNAQLIFLDTPGIHQARRTFNQRMVQTALVTLEEVDLILLLHDPQKGADILEPQIVDHLKKLSTPTILVVNKIDLFNRDQFIPMLDRYNREDLFSEVIPVSALTGENVDRLLELLRNMLPEGEPLFPKDLLTDQPIRHLAAEMIREKAILKTREELPYAIAVEIESFKEDPKKQWTSIHATLFVERSSQKGILIGQKGQMLKEIREEAQKELKKLLGTKISLALWVKVKKNWSRDKRFLTQMGY